MKHIPKALVQPYFKIKKTDLSSFPKLHQQLMELSEVVNESTDSYLYSPLAGKLEMFVTKFNEANIAYSLVSQTQLHRE